MKPEPGARKQPLLTRIGATLAAVLAAVLAAPAIAGEVEAEKERQIEEIIVSATFRDTAMMDTPIAISSLTDELLEDKGAINIQTMYQSVPSLSYRTNSNTFNTISIRGLTPIAGTSVVSVYVDEVPVTDQNDGGIRQIAGTLFDLERVEVLKGPQGTLYGEKAASGAHCATSPRTRTRTPLISKLSAMPNRSAKATTSAPASMPW